MTRWCTRRYARRSRDPLRGGGASERASLSSRHLFHVLHRFFYLYVVSFDHSGRHSLSEPCKYTFHQFTQLHLHLNGETPLSFWAAAAWVFRPLFGAHTLTGSRGDSLASKSPRRTACHVGGRLSLSPAGSSGRFAEVSGSASDPPLPVFGGTLKPN